MGGSIFKRMRTVEGDLLVGLGHERSPDLAQLLFLLLFFFFFLLLFACLALLLLLLLLLVLLCH